MQGSGGGSLRASAPARANLLGNPSDLTGGAVLACSVPERAHVVLEPAERCTLEADGVGVAVSSPADLRLRGDVFDLARAALRGQEPLPCCRIVWRSEIPRQSGLAGSTALLVALLRALDAWRGRESERTALAERARWVERRELGVVCGWVDHYLCSFGGFHLVDFRGKERDLPPEQSPPATLRTVSCPAEGMPFLLAFTGVRHRSGSVHAPARARFERGDPEVIAAHARLRALAYEGLPAFETHDWDALGALMNENHAIQRGLGGSGEVNERLIQAARAAGAPGAKLAGAGHGGTIVALWPDADAAPLEAALRRAGAAAFFRPAPVPGVTLEAQEGAWQGTRTTSS